MIEDPTKALSILLEEIKRQKSVGVRRVLVSDESVALLKKMAEAHAPTVTKPLPDSHSAKRSGSTRPQDSHQAFVRPATSMEPKSDITEQASPIPDPPVLTLPAGTKAERMQALKLILDSCAETQKHLESGHRPLLGHGSLDAKVVFIGEAPSFDEMEAGKVFAGPSGEILNKILTAASLKPEDFYLAPATVWRPKTASRYQKRPPHTRELAFNLPYLRAQIEIVAPSIVVALGAVAFTTLHGPKPPITEARGHWFDFFGRPLMPTYHPNYLLHDNKTSTKRIVWEDFLQIMEKLHIPISEKQRGYFR